MPSPHFTHPRLHPLCLPALPAEYFIPAGILLKCFMEVSDREMYDKLVHSVQGVRRRCRRSCAALLFLFVALSAGHAVGVALWCAGNS